MRIKSKDLCCLVKQTITCRFCKDTHCKDCGGAFGHAQHYVINMCRKRFYSWELFWATDCYSKRKRFLIGKGLKGLKRTLLGDCIICEVARELGINDRQAVPTDIIHWSTDMSEIWSVAKLAKKLSVSLPTAYIAVKTGQIPAVKIGKQWRISSDEVDQLLRGMGGGNGEKNKEERPFQ